MKWALFILVYLACVLLVAHFSVMLMMPDLPPSAYKTDLEVPP
jgi:hypothetical protein